MLWQTMCVWASAIALGVGFAGSAAAVDFKFQFENELNGGGTVEGLIRGLSDEGTSAATSVEITSNTAGFGLGEYVGNPLINSWTVSGGTLTDFAFSSSGSRNTSPAVTDNTLFLNSSLLAGASFRAGLSNSPGSIVIGVPGVTTADIALTFPQDNGDTEPVPDTSVTAAVPEATSIWALVAVGALMACGALQTKAS